jgi:hypothetical protein
MPEEPVTTYWHIRFHRFIAAPKPPFDSTGALRWTTAILWAHRSDDWDLGAAKAAVADEAAVWYLVAHGVDLLAAGGGVEVDFVPYDEANPIGPSEMVESETLLDDWEAGEE